MLRIGVFVGLHIGVLLGVLAFCSSEGSETQGRGGE
jgi:hypothetical protein